MYAQLTNDSLALLEKVRITLKGMVAGAPGSYNEAAKNGIREIESILDRSYSLPKEQSPVSNIEKEVVKNFVQLAEKHFGGLSNEGGEEDQYQIEVKVRAWISLQEFKEADAYTLSDYIFRTYNLTPKNINS